MNKILLIVAVLSLTLAFTAIFMIGVIQSHPLTIEVITKPAEIIYLRPIP
jgi:hypothetical protein